MSLVLLYGLKKFNKLYPSFLHIFQITKNINALDSIPTRKLKKNKFSSPCPYENKRVVWSFLIVVIYPSSLI